MESVKAQLDILSLARSFGGINLKQHGTVHRGGCPCCGASDKKEPFQVDPRPGGKGPHFHCFSCGENGDVFNLFALQQRGEVQIPKDKFIAVVRAAAEAYGIPIPERGAGAARSPEQQLRAEVQTAWAAAHQYAREIFLKRSGREQRDPDSLRPLGAASRIGVLDTGLDAHLTRLGISDAGRGRAGLTLDDIDSFAPGVVLLRTAGGAPAGFSQQFSDRQWVHRHPAGVKLEPAFLSARPSGRPTHRVLVLVSDADRAGRLAANLAALAKADSEEARRVATVGIIAVPFDDPLDTDALARLTKRAVILAPSVETSVRATSEFGARLLTAGIAVRVADALPCSAGTAPIGDRVADGTRALDTWDEADDYITWQAKQIPTPQGVQSWQVRRIPALLAAMPDPVMREVFAYRATVAAEEARARIAEAVGGATTQADPAPALDQVIPRVTDVGSPMSALDTTDGASRGESCELAADDATSATQTDTETLSLGL